MKFFNSKYNQSQLWRTTLELKEAKKQILLTPLTPAETVVFENKTNWSNEVLEEFFQVKRFSV